MGTFPTVRRVLERCVADVARHESTDPFPDYKAARSYPKSRIFVWIGSKELQCGLPSALLPQLCQSGCRAKLPSLRC
jgi:hypothetical protein